MAKLNLSGANANPFETISKERDKLNTPVPPKPVATPPEAPVAPTPAPAPVAEQKPAAVETPEPRPAAQPPAPPVPQPQESAASFDPEPRTTERPKRRAAPTTGAYRQKVKRFGVLWEEAVEMDQVSAKVSGKLGATIDFAKLTRALWSVLLEHQDDIVERLPVDEEWSRPANADPAGCAEFDLRLSKAMEDAIYKTMARLPRRR